MNLIKDSYGKSFYTRYIKIGNNQFQIPFASQVLASPSEKMFAVFTVETNSWVIYDNTGKRQISNADYKNIQQILDDGSVVCHVGEGHAEKTGAYKTLKYDSALFKDGQQLLTSRNSNFKLGVANSHYINETSTFQFADPYGRVVSGKGKLSLAEVDGFYVITDSSNNKLGYIDMLGRPLNNSSTPSTAPTRSGMDFYQFYKGSKNLSELKGEYYKDPVFRKAVLNELKRKAQIEINYAQIDTLVRLDNPEKFKKLLNELNHKFKDAQRSVGKEQTENITKQSVNKIEDITNDWKAYLEKIVEQVSTNNY